MHASSATTAQPTGAGTPLIGKAAAVLGAGDVAGALGAALPGPDGARDSVRGEVDKGVPSPDDPKVPGVLNEDVPRPSGEVDDGGRGETVAARPSASTLVCE